MDGASAGNDHMSDLKDGSVFVVEIELEGQDGYPEITLSRFQYDLSMWERVPAVSDHWLFQNPYRLDNHFEITYETEFGGARRRKSPSKNTGDFSKPSGKAFRSPPSVTLRRLRRTYSKSC